MSWDVLKVLSTTKGNPEFYLLSLSQLLYDCHCQYYHVSVHSSNKNLVEALHNSITDMHHDP